jgi:hypothetical protein
VAKNWAQVEKDKIINQLLVDVAAGKKSVDDAAITTDLNAAT